MKTTFTLEEVQNAINITAIVAREIGNPKDAAKYMKENVPEELHSPIIAALFGAALFPAIAGSDNDIDKPKKEESKCSCGSKCDCNDNKEEDDEELSREDVKKMLIRMMLGF